MNRPSVDECLQAFEQILDKITPEQMIMLRANYHSGGRAATMRELAKAAGYGDYKIANLQYGSIAKRFYEAIGLPAPLSPRSGKPYWILGLGDFVDRHEFGLEMHCVMRPEVASALERLAIVFASVESDRQPSNESSEFTIMEHEPKVSSEESESATVQKTKTSETHPIRVDFIRSDEFPILNRLGMTFAPGKKQTDALSGVWDRDLRTDIQRLSDEFGTGTLISLVQQDELEELSITDLAEECDRAMINLVLYPIRDGSVPESVDDFGFMVARAVDSLYGGETVVAHCKGGLGRAGLTAACIAVAATGAEISATEAIELVRLGRPGAVETEAQEQFVAEFEEVWRKVVASRGDDHLLYWQERSVHEHASNDLPLDVVASNQLVDVFPSDTVWIVTLTQERELVLAGRLVVGEIVEFEEAVRRLPGAGLWQAEYYAFPEPGTEEGLREIDIQHLAEDLRFDGEDDRFILHDGKINPQQLRSIRRLTRESADLLVEAFGTIGPVDIDELDPEAMLNVTRQVVQMTPDDADAQYNFGIALGLNEMYEEEISAYQRTLDLDPGYFGAQYNLGNAFIRLGRYDEAVEALNRAILISGEYPPAHFMLGVAYFEAGRFEDAVAATRQGLEIDPDDASAYYNIAYWTFRQGDYRRAFELADEVFDHDPKRPGAAVLKGKCYRTLGEIEHEIESYREALDLGMDLDALFFLGAAWERKITGLDTGIDYVEANGTMDLHDPKHLFCFAIGYLALGERDTAEESIDGLRSTAPDLARRLEAALRYTNLETSDTHPRRVGMLGEAPSEEQSQQTDLASDIVPGVPEQTISVRQSQPRKKIRLIVGEAEITAKHIPDLYSQVLEFLVRTAALDNLDLPISSGRKRNFLSRTPIHKDGTNFLAPVEFGGYYMEAHSSRENGMKMLQAFLENLGIESTVVAEEGGAAQALAELRSPTSHERVIGSLFGLAVCDSLGTPAEFKPPGTFPEITSMIGGGPFSLNPGEWTDDTSMALCLADSLVETGGFDARDQMDRYLRWKNEGYLSSNGQAFDIGITIRTALDKYAQQSGERDPFCGSISPSSAGNGSLMRLAPVPLFFRGEPRQAIARAAESSRTTHAARECLDACRYFTGLIIGALQGRTKDEILSTSFSPVPELWSSEPLSQRIAVIAEGSFKARKAPEISSTGQGYVVLSLHAALWAFYHTRTFQAGALKVVNLGYDSDTYGAIYGQLAGAYYGVKAIPSDWIGQLAHRDLIERLATGLINRNGTDNI